MKNMKKLFALMLMMASVLFFACSEDEDEKKFTKEEVVTEIEQVSTQMTDKLTRMEESEGMEAVEALMSLEDPFMAAVKSTKQTAVLSNIKNYLLPHNYIKKDNRKTAFEAEPFNFEAWVGTYTWNNEFEKWDIQSNSPDNQIIIIFPADTTNLDNNNAKLTVYNYDEILLYYEYLPTDVDADLYVDQTKVVDIDLTATWFDSGEYKGEPSALNVSVYLIPFEFTGSFVHTSTNASVDFAILDEGVEFFTTGIDATWASATDSIPSNINGYISFFDVKFYAEVDMLNMIDVFNKMFFMTEQQIIDALNEEIEAYIAIDGVWAADIELGLLPPTEMGGDYDIDILFVYADGTSESAIPYFEELILEMENLFGELDIYYSTW